MRMILMLRLDKFGEKLFDKVGKILLRLQVLPEPLLDARSSGMGLQRHRPMTQHVWFAAVGGSL